MSDLLVGVGKRGSRFYLFYPLTHKLVISTEAAHSLIVSSAAENPLCLYRLPATDSIAFAIARSLGN